MKALILAAGLGTRLGALTVDRPKPMLPIGGRPLLEHLVLLLRAHGVREIAINLHYQPDAIRDHFGDGHHLGVSIIYSEEPRLFGTAGAARALAAFLDESFFVLYGDVLTDENLGDLAAWHQAMRATLTMALYRVEDPTRVGIVETGPDGQVLRFKEKPEPTEVFSDLASTGVLIAEPSILAYIPPDRQWDIGHDLLPALLADGAPIYGRLAQGYVLDIGDEERYRQADQDVRYGRVRMPSAASPVPTDGRRC